MRTKILQDSIACGVEAYQTLPKDFSNEAEGIAWGTSLCHGLLVVGYDAVKTDTTGTAMATLSSMGDVTDEEVEQAYAAYCLLHVGGPVGKIGDGTILNFLKGVDWKSLISTVLTIISLIPKAAA